MKNFLILMMMLTVFFGSGCASKKTQASKSKLNKVFVEQNLRKNKTSKLQVVELLGHPEMVNSDSDGKEQWVYSKRASESDSQGAGVGLGALTFVGGMLAGVDMDLEQSSETKSSLTTTLTVYFNKKGRVERYNFSSQRF